MTTRKLAVSARRQANPSTASWIWSHQRKIRYKGDVIDMRTHTGQRRPTKPNVYCLRYKDVHGSAKQPANASEYYDIKDTKTAYDKPEQRPHFLILEDATVVQLLDTLYRADMTPEECKLSNRSKNAGIIIEAISKKGKANESMQAAVMRLMRSLWRVTGRKRVVSDERWGMEDVTEA